MATLIINGYSVNSNNAATRLPRPAYKGVQWAVQDIDYDAGRTMDGTMVRNVVARKRKLTITWPPMKPADVSRVLNAVNQTTFMVTAFDLLDNADREMEMYVGDRTIPYLSEMLGDKNANGTYTGLCDSFSIGLIEV